jgi:hypothetical protein
MVQKKGVNSGLTPERILNALNSIILSLGRAPAHPP